MLRKILLSVLMLTTALAAVALRPEYDTSQGKDLHDLEKLVPSSFGDWKEIKNGGSLVINPQQQQTLAEIYSQTLSRTYINRDGYRIMLSIAYGGQQSKALQVHRPETCYAAQGFEIQGMRKDKISLLQNTVPIMRLKTQLGARDEPVSYWVRIGEKVVIGNFQQSLTRFEYGLSGTVPDGILVRVSSISKDTTTAYDMQDQFLLDLYKELGPEAQAFFIGVDTRV